MRSPIYFYTLAMAPPYYTKLPWKIMLWGEHLDSLEDENEIEGWKGWALYPNDDVLIWPPIDVVEN